MAGTTVKTKTISKRKQGSNENRPSVVTSRFTAVKDEDKAQRLVPSFFVARRGFIPRSTLVMYKQQQVASSQSDMMIVL